VSVLYDRAMTRQIALVLAALAVSIVAGAGAAAPPASAVVFGTLTTYPVEVDVDLRIVQRTSWTGIRPGCFAPAENFSQTYTFDVDSRPQGRRSAVRPGTATVSDLLVGVTPSFGASGGFRQSAAPGAWELQVANPPACNATAPAVPEWATSPKCAVIRERVAASLQMEEDRRNGRLVISRTPKRAALALVNATPLGGRCHRTLGNVEAVAVAADLAIGLRATAISIPVRSLRAKLEALGEGSASARPSFRIPVTFSGRCSAMKVSGSFADRPGFTPSPFSGPNRALGNPEDANRAASCTVTGGGDYTVRRVGAARTTALPVGAR
jgi:hypothetical protein